MGLDSWHPHFNQHSPVYEIFSWLPTHFITQKSWPTIFDYNALAQFTNKSLTNQQGMPIKFVPQGEKSSVFKDNYEPRIFLSGEIQTRCNNWHDFFNMLIWYTFPMLKKSLNAFQYEALLQRKEENKQRTKLENFLTLFDENGVIVASADEHLFRLIQNMEWKSLFWQQRTKLIAKLRCYVFGHSLHEKLLNPYKGIVGHSLLISVPENFFKYQIEDQLFYLEEVILRFQLSSMTTKDLWPIPILGFPNWYPESARELFYDDENYFRKKKITVNSNVSTTG